MSKFGHRFFRREEALNTNPSKALAATNINPASFEEPIDSNPPTTCGCIACAQENAINALILVGRPEDIGHLLAEELTRQLPELFDDMTGPIEPLTDPALSRDRQLQVLAHNSRRPIEEATTRVLEKAAELEIRRVNKHLKTVYISDLSATTNNPVFTVRSKKGVPIVSRPTLDGAIEMAYILDIARQLD